MPEQRVIEPPLMLSQIGSLYNNMRRECDRLFRELDIPIDGDQVPVLMTLYYCGALSQQEMSTKLVRDKASVARTVAFLAKKGFAKVVQDSLDKRKNRVELTGAGKKLAIKANVVVEKVASSLSAVLTEEESRQFQGMMRKLISLVVTVYLPFVLVGLPRI